MFPQSDKRNRLATALAAVISLVIGCFVFAAPASADPVYGAVSWARARLGQSIYYNECLQFVHDAYASGGGVEIGSASSAVAYWNGHGSAQHPGDTNPPQGALVFWGATTGAYPNPDGHVALSEGGGTVISSYERSTTTIHEFAIATRNAAGYPYLGWLMPPGVSTPSGPTGNGTLYFIKTKNTGSGRVEVHSATPGSGYQTGMHAATWFSSAEQDNGWFQMVGANLYFIKTRNTGSGRVEVHSATAASGYQSGVHYASALSVADAGNGWFQMAGADLVFIKTRNTSSGRVEFFRLTAGSGYSQFATTAVTAFSPADASNGWFQAQGLDLVFIKTRNTGSGRVEYFRAPASGGYRTITVATGTAFSPADQNNGWFSSEDVNSDGHADLIFVKTHNPQSGQVEFFVADGSRNYQQITSGAVTWLSPVDADNGWFQADSKD